MKKARRDWFRWRLPAIVANPHCVVFIDETSVKTNMTRLRGRSPYGTRLTSSAPFGAWGTQTFIAGLTHDSLVAPWVIKGAMNGDAFAAYVRDVLVPEHSRTCSPQSVKSAISSHQMSAGTIS